MSHRPALRPAAFRLAVGRTFESLSVALVLLLTLAVACLGASVAAAVEGSGLVVEGRVVWAGEPVPGAWVELTPLVGPWQLGDLFFQGKTRPEAVARTVSGGDGAFTLRAPEAGMWRITVGANGRVPVQLSLVPLFRDAAGVHGELPEAELGPDHGLAVRVVDAVGRPLANAAVLAFDRATARRGRDGLPEPSWQRALELVFTDEDGRARLRGRRGETLRIQVAEPDHASAVAEVRLPVAGELEVPLAPGRPVTVRAEAAGTGPGGGGAGEGEPVPNALVWAGESPFPIGWTGDDGRTAVVLPEQDVLTLVARTEDGRSAVYRLATSSRLESLRLPLRARGVRTGRVLRRGGQEPVAGALVWPWSRPHRAVRSDADGWFRLEAEEGEYVAAARRGHRPGGVHLTGEIGVDRPAVVQLEQVASLSGLVVDGDGRPVPGLGLRIERAGVFWRGESAWPLRTGDDGTFRLADVPVGERLRAEIGGVDAFGTPWSVVAREVEPLAPGEERAGTVWRAERGLTAIGRVVDEADAPVAGAAVRLVDTDPRRRALHLPPLEVPQGRSDAAGAWEIAGLRPGVFDLEVTARGFAAVRVPGLDVGRSDDGPGPGDSKPVDLGTVVLAPGVEMAGRVVDEDGRPVAGAEVWPASVDGPGGGEPRQRESHQTVTDDEGRFVLRDLRPGRRLDVAAEHPDHLPTRVGTVTAPAPDEVAEELEIVLARGTSLLGRVTDPAGRPVANAAVALFDQGGGGAARGRQTTTTTDGQGAFELHRVPAGPATLQVSHGDVPDHSEPVELQPAHRGPTRVDVVLRGAEGSLRGTVRDREGEPVAAALVLLPGDGVVRAASTRTDAEGAYELRNLDPGRREVVVHHASFASFRAEVEVDAAAWLDVELRRGVTASGVVVDAEGEPVAGARILTTPLAEAARATRESATTGADGRFQLQRLLPGRYLLRAQAPGHYEVTDAEPILLDRDVEGLRLTLHRGVTLTGRVVGVAFDDLPTVRVEAHRIESSPASDPFPLPPTSELDYEGGFRLEGLSPGLWRVSARQGTDGGQRSVDVRIGDGTPPQVVLEMGDGYTVSGRLAIRGLESGSWTERTHVALRPAAAEGEARRPGLRMTPLAPGGRFTFRDVDAGTYELSVLGIAGRLGRRQVEVQGDVELTLEVSVARLAGTVRSRTGRPLGDVELRLTGGGPDVREHLATFTGDDGRFLLEALPPGSYTLRATRDGFAPGELVLTVPEGPSADVELVLDPAPPGED